MTLNLIVYLQEIEDFGILASQIAIYGVSFCVQSICIQGIMQ